MIPRKLSDHVWNGNQPAVRIALGVSVLGPIVLEHGSGRTPRGAAHVTLLEHGRKNHESGACSAQPCLGSISPARARPAFTTRSVQPRLSRVRRIPVGATTLGRVLVEPCSGRVGPIALGRVLVEPCSSRVGPIALERDRAEPGQPGLGPIALDHDQAEPGFDPGSSRTRPEHARPGSGQAWLRVLGSIVVGSGPRDPARPDHARARSGRSRLIMIGPITITRTPAGLVPPGSVRAERGRA